MKLYLFENAIYKPNDCPFPGFLIKTENGKNILIDTGIQQIDADIINNRNGSNDIEIGESRLPIILLKQLSLTPNEIDYVINTHFHYDHCGFNALF